MKYKMNRGLVIWKGTWSENRNGCELGRQMEFPGRFSIGPQLGDGEGFLVRKSRWTLVWE